MAMPWLHCGYIVTAAMAAAQPGERLLCQPGQRLCYGYHGSQERINVSAVPTAP